MKVNRHWLLRHCEERSNLFSVQIASFLAMTALFAPLTFKKFPFRVFNGFVS